MKTLTRSQADQDPAHWARSIQLDSLLRISLAMTLLLALCSMLLISISRATPIPESDLGLAECAGAPCFRGLEPGRTRWETALTSLDGEIRTRRDPAYGRIALIPSSDSSVLEAVLLQRPRDRSLTLATILARYGRPTCIEIYAETGAFVLHYPYLHVSTTFSDNRLSPNNPVGLIAVVDQNALEPRFGSVCNLSEIEADNRLLTRHIWSGFAMMQRYLSSAA